MQISNAMGCCCPGLCCMVITLLGAEDPGPSVYEGGPHTTQDASASDQTAMHDKQSLAMSVGAGAMTRRSILAFIGPTGPPGLWYHTIWGSHHHMTRVSTSLELPGCSEKALGGSTIPQIAEKRVTCSAFSVLQEMISMTPQIAQRPQVTRPAWPAGNDHQQLGPEVGGRRGSQAEGRAGRYPAGQPRTSQAQPCQTGQQPVLAESAQIRTRTAFRHLCSAAPDPQSRVSQTPVWLASALPSTHLVMKAPQWTQLQCGYSYQTQCCYSCMHLSQAASL